MDFLTRNEQWTGEPREFHQTVTRSSAPRVWKIWVQGPTVFVQHGQLGGVLQQTHETMTGVNHGKKNEKSPEVYAIERARYYAEKKSREGYREVGADGQFLDAHVSEIDFDRLPQNLCFWKPDNSPGATIEKKAKDGKLWYARKRDGEMIAICKGSGIPQIYSRRMHRKHDDEENAPFTWDDRFPHLIELLDSVMPANSILLGELVMDIHGRDERKLAGSYMRSLSPQAVADMQTNGYPSFYCWDVAFWEGEDWVSKKPVKERYKLIHEIPLLVGTEFKHRFAAYFLPVQVENFQSIEAARENAKVRGWEGFIAIDPDGVFEDRAYNFKGKPDRPSKFAAKVKPEFEDDFVAMWDPSRGYGEFSTKGKYVSGDRPGIKSVALYQINSKGEWVYICNCATGMSEEMKRDWADPKLFPMVWQVGYSARTYISQGDDTNALTFPKYLDRRQDKAVAECINPEL